MGFLKKIISFFFVFLLTFIIVFYFWAKQANYSHKEYSEIIQFSYKNKLPLQDTFSVMTYNIGYLSGMKNNLAIDMPKELFASNLESANELIISTSADIVAMQEIDFHSSRSYFANQFIELGEKTGYSVGGTSVNWDKRYVPFPYWPFKFHFGEMLSGQAVLSNSPIISNERVVLPKPKSNPFYYNAFYLERLAQLVWVEKQGDSLLIINVHFEAWDGPTREKHAEIVLDIFKRYESDYPIILMGDFNCNPPYSVNALNEKTIATLINYPNISSAISQQQYNGSPELFFTFSSGSPYEKIDYIFYNNKYLSCYFSKVIHPKTEISDHLPVYARFATIQ